MAVAAAAATATLHADPELRDARRPLLLLLVIVLAIGSSSPSSALQLCCAPASKKNASVLRAIFWFAAQRG